MIFPTFILQSLQNLRALVAIFLFTCLVLPLLGSYAWLSDRMVTAKEVANGNIKKAIPPEDQILWKFSLGDAQTKLFWEHSREFEYKGEMYDVLRSKAMGDSVWYWCYWDRKETKLKKQLSVVISQMMGPGPQSRNHGTQINTFFKSFFFQVTCEVAKVTFFIPQNQCNAPYHFALSVHDLLPPLPPPKYS